MKDWNVHIPPWMGALMVAFLGWFFRWLWKTTKASINEEIEKRLSGYEDNERHMEETIRELRNKVETLKQTIGDHEEKIKSGIEAKEKADYIMKFLLERKS